MPLEARLLEIIQPAIEPPEVIALANPENDRVRSARFDREPDAGEQQRQFENDKDHAASLRSAVIPSRPRCSATYFGLSSMPMYCRPCSSATSPVVPAPLNGSRTIPPRREPARMQGSMSFGGNVAKCAPLNGCVATVQTSR